MPTPTATPAPSPTPTPAATPTAIPSILALGAQQTYPDGTSASVYAVQLASGTGAQAGAGTRLLAIDVQVCTGPRVAGLTLSPAQFGLELPDGSRHAGISGSVNPALRAQTLAAGQCARGWVTVPVPKAPDPRYITAQLPGYDAARWVFPGL